MFFRRVCGVDLGTDTIKICDKNEKLYLCEKNMVAIRDKSHVISIGNDAFEIYEKAPANVEIKIPMTNGAIADVKNLDIILSKLLRKYSSVMSNYPDVIMTAPNEISQVEKRAYYHALTGGVRAKRIGIIEKGIADAIGIGISMDSPEGTMIVNIGAATTEISVISEGKIIIGRMFQTGGYKMDESIITLIRRRYDLNIGQKTAAILKERMAYMEQGAKAALKVYGIHTVSGLPKWEEIPALDVSVSIIETVDEIVGYIRSVLERTPPQLYENISGTGIFFTGGVSQIPNLTDYVSKELGIAVHNVDNPAYSTIRGLIQVTKSKELQKLTYSLREYTGNTI